MHTHYNNVYLKIFKWVGYVVAESIKVEARCVECDRKGERKRKIEWVRGHRESKMGSVCERESMTRAWFYPGTALRIKRLPWKPVNTTTLRYHTSFYHVYSLSFSLFFTRFLTAAAAAAAFSAHHQHYHPPPHTHSFPWTIPHRLHWHRSWQSTLPLTVVVPVPQRVNRAHVIPPAANLGFISVKSVSCLDPYTRPVEPFLPLSLLPSNYYYISFVEWWTAWLMRQRKKTEQRDGIYNIQRRRRAKKRKADTAKKQLWSARLCVWEREREIEWLRKKNGESREKAHAFISNKSSVLPRRPSVDCYHVHSPPTPIIHATLKKTRHFLWAHEF
jgi:hypothetical protein